MFPGYFCLPLSSYTLLFSIHYRYLFCQLSYYWLLYLVRITIGTGLGIGRSKLRNASKRFSIVTFLSFIFSIVFYFLSDYMLLVHNVQWSLLSMFRPESGMPTEPAR